MTIQFFDLAGAEKDVRFSPYCWRTKMALAHKGLDFETVPWCFTDKEAIAKSGQARVPVLVDGDKWIFDSWSIACYLDETYPEKPLMDGDAVRALSHFVNNWCDQSVNPALRALGLLAVYRILDEKDKEYFRQSREEALGMSLEEASADQSGARKNLKVVLAPAETSVSQANFLGGAEPCYADYALFGSLKWIQAVCGTAPLETDSAIENWFERMLDLHDGLARKAPTAS